LAWIALLFLFSFPVAFPFLSPCPCPSSLSLSLSFFSCVFFDDLEDLTCLVEDTALEDDGGREIDEDKDKDDDDDDDDDDSIDTDDDEEEEEEEEEEEACFALIRVLFVIYLFFCAITLFFHSLELTLGINTGTGGTELGTETGASVCVPFILIMGRRLR
jgi:hypothetical protein